MWGWANITDVFQKIRKNNCYLRYAGRINLSFRGVKRYKFDDDDNDADDELLCSERQINKLINSKLFEKNFPRILAHFYAGCFFCVYFHSYSNIRNTVT
jgi:hypothetical protein